MELSPRRLKVGLALHALGCVLMLLQREPVAWAAMACVLAASSAVLTRSVVKQLVVLSLGGFTAYLCVELPYGFARDFGHLVVIAALAVPAIVDAAGSGHERRARFLWVRALALMVAWAVGVGIWPAPAPTLLLPIALASHVLLRLGVTPVDRAPLAARTVVVLAGLVVVLLGVAHFTDVRWELFGDARSGDPAQGTILARVLVWGVPGGPWASAALFVAFAAAVLRIAPRAGLDGALLAAVVLALALDLRSHDWWTVGTLVAPAACFAATTVAQRHVGLRVFAALTIVASVWLGEHERVRTEPAWLAAIAAIVVVAAVGFAGIAGARLPAVARAPVRSLAVDGMHARVGALLHAVALGLTVFLPTGSLAALVPAIVFATRPLARVGTLVAVGAAWAVAPFLGARLGDEGVQRAVLAWLPWIVLAVIEVARSRGQLALVLRLAAAVAAALLAVAFDAATPALLVGAIAVQAFVERAAGTTRPVPRFEPLSLLVAVPLLAGLPIFEFVMRWLVSKDGPWPLWELHPVTVFLIDGGPALACLWLVAQAGLRRGLPFLAPGGAMLAAAGVVLFAEDRGHIHDLAAAAVALFCVGALTRPPLLRFASAWLAALAACIVLLRAQLPRPDLVVETGYPLWVVLWFALLVGALVLSDAMRAAPLLAAPRPS